MLYDVITVACDLLRETFDDGGAIHVGDRVRFVRDGVEYVGDIVDISMLRMTMHEDVTLTSYMSNRRAGRMIFIPNHFIFTVV